MLTAGGECCASSMPNILVVSLGYQGGERVGNRSANWSMASGGDAGLTYQKRFEVPKGATHRMEFTRLMAFVASLIYKDYSGC